MEHKHLLLLVCLLSVGCSPSAEELISGMQRAHVTSYAFDLAIESEVVASAERSVTSEVSMQGEVDVANRRMHAVQTTNAGFQGMTAVVETESYVVGDQLFLKAQDQWMLLPVDAWTSYDRLSQVISLVQNSTDIEVHEESDYYLLDIRPDLAHAMQFLAAQQELSEFMEGGVARHNLSATLFVHKDTFVTERAIAEMRLSLDRLDVQARVDVRLSDINEPVDIVLPAEAQGAMRINDDAPTKMISVTGSVISQELN